MAEQSGFMAIQPPVPQAPYARRKVVRGPDGTPQVILVDMNGNPIADPSGYGVVESGNYLDPNSLPGTATSTPGQTGEPQREGGSTARSLIKETTRGEKDSSQPGSGSFGRGASDNFGYINKPGALGFAGMLPGPLGLAGKGVNAAINANNVAAVNAARGMLGLPGTGIGGAIKGTLKDNKGQVADVTLGNSQYATPVGFEALSPDGMTNMTPHEAALRANAVGGIQLATKEQIEARDQAFESEFGKPGLFGRMTNVATSFIDSLFGTPSTYNAAQAEATRQQNTGSNFNPSRSGFADMIGSSGSLAKDTSTGGLATARTADRNSVPGYSGANGGDRSSSSGGMGNRATSGPTGGRLAGPV